MVPKFKDLINIILVNDKMYSLPIMERVWFNNQIIVNIKLILKVRVIFEIRKFSILNLTKTINSIKELRVKITKFVVIYH
jgi:hypothetical protein